MYDRAHHRRMGLALALLVGAAGGCERWHSRELPGSGLARDGEAAYRQAERHRKRFQTEKDPAALRWLLEHRIHAGMSLAEVGRALGEEGERVFDDNWLKSDGGNYRADDVAYRWGPDSQGKSVYLVFRDGRLMYFDADELQ